MMRPSSKYILGALGLILVALTIAFLLKGEQDAATSVVENSPFITVTYDDPFIHAERYFNADDDPEGPYDLEQARYYYEQVIAASSTQNEIVWYQLGRIDFLEGKFDAAIAKFTTQIEHFGDVRPQVHYMLGLTYAYKAKQTGSADDWQKGEEAFETFLTFKPESPWARTDLAWIYFAQGKYTEMLPLLEEGLVYEPESAWLHNMYGLALLNLEDKEGAREHFARALASAKVLTAAEWGAAYPGNDPSAWDAGLASFRTAIAENLALAGGA